MSQRLRGMTWNHPRGLDPLLACSEAYVKDHPGIEIDWEARSLHDFGEAPFEELAASYDLLVFDHPWIGMVAESGVLIPLDTVLQREFLADQARNSVGSSHASYQWGGHQWALAIDAACHVSAWRPDLIERPPATWSDVADLARAAPGRVVVPGAPVDAYISFLTLMANAVDDPLPDGGIDPDVAADALAQLADLMRLAHPKSLEWNPIQALEVMTTTDEVLYTPLTFGYVNYATPGFRPSSLRFGAIPTGARGVAGGVLGGAGLGVSVESAHQETAVDFARFVASAEVQHGVYVRSNGQPGHRSAWVSDEVNESHGGFFADTLAGIDASFLRPRSAAFPAVQADAIAAVHEWLTEGAPDPAGFATRIAEIFAARR
ncbi:extracellular solute-binding protein [Microbacterium sulfonylureivorans]|uniref:extracellular solute-binding protein n=1 Tax=Microbacterium sulfonylureivorans TaxID=2486854 RepID=UPI000FD86ED6|nr:extracellular solute-binding protein [Microbacterium sulfonylureivorans]